MSQVALCYVRKSLVRDLVDEISPQRQKDSISREAEQRGLVAELYSDAEGHRSGRNENRPGWLSLKDQLDRPEVKVVIVESLSRASRSIRDLFNFVHELERRSIDLVSIKERVDTSTAMGRAFFGIIAVLNQFESDVASERASMNIEFLQRGRGRHWGQTPFGCKRDSQDRRLKPSSEGVWWTPSGQVVVGGKDSPAFIDGAGVEWRGYYDALQRCYEIYLENRIGYLKIDDELNAEGFRWRGRDGLPRKFNADDIRRMIDMNLIYSGRTVLGRSKDGVTSSVKGSHEPILPLEMCARVAELRRERHALWAKGGGGRPKYVYLYRNLYCADCGSRLSGMFANGKRTYRHYDSAIKCPTSQRRVNADDIEAQLWYHLNGLRSPDELKERIRAKALRLSKTSEGKDLTAARREQKRLEQSDERLHELYIEGEISRTEYDKRRQKQATQLAQARMQIARIAPDLSNLERIFKKLDDLAELIQSGSLEQQRDAIDALIEREEQRDGKLLRIVPRAWAAELLESASRIPIMVISKKEGFSGEN